MQTRIVYIESTKTERIGRFNTVRAVQNLLQTPQVSGLKSPGAAACAHGTYVRLEAAQWQQVDPLRPARGGREKFYEVG